ncbi:MAG: SCO family protein [Proteobacteria bacterium]|nr:SCO family protein [Pseudomonadota bacterium]
MKKHTLFIILIIGIAIAIGVWRDNNNLASTQSNANVFTTLPLSVGTALPQPHKLPAFNLIDTDGKPFSNEALKDRWSFLFFGYSQCPGVCPATLGVMDQISAKLGNHHNVQFIFVSIDPENDTPQALKKFLQQDKFQKTPFVGLTGDKDNVAMLAKKVGIHVADEQKLPISKEHIEHGGAILLVNPEGKLMAIFTTTDKPNAIVRDFKEIVHYYVNAV